MSAGPRRRPRRRGLRARLWRHRRLLLLLALLAAVSLAGLAAIVSRVELPPEPSQARTSFVVDRNGAPLGQFHAEVNRVPVPLGEVAAVARTAVLAAEDRDFYRHAGLSPRGIVRALWADVRGRPLQGGSTITQQLVKNSYLTNERSLARKLREAVLAVKIEGSLSKDAIFERYLNTIYFGRGAYGIEAAARTYFGTTAARLDLSQAALLAGLIRSPHRADPVRAPEEGRRRRRVVLQSMVAAGDISPARAAQVDDAPLGARPPSGDVMDSATPGTRHVLEWVRRQLVRRFGERTVYGGGLRVELTLDVELQRAAEQSVAAVLDRPDDPEAALVSVDADGRVLAMVGGRDFGHSEVNLALGAAGGGTGRQAGSAFKPFVLATAVDEGVPVRQTFDAPAAIDITLPNGQPWHVSNYDDESFGRTDLVDATAHSVNTVYAQLIDEVGPQRVTDLARRLGIRSPLEPLHSLALGTEAVAPLDMASAYMTFGRRGEWVEPHVIARVTDDAGHVLLEVEPERDEVMAPEEADTVNAVLRTVVERGTGRGAAIGRPVAGKTGTTQGYGDAWFVGYTPQLATAVWIGYPEGQARAMTDVHGRKVTGGSFPADVWRRFMERAVRDLDPVDFVAPPESAMAVPTTTSTTSASPSTPSTGPPTTPPPPSTTSVGVS